MSNTRDIRNHDFSIQYGNKSFGQSFVDYSGPTFFNSMPIESKTRITIIIGDTFYVKCLINKYLFF